MDSHKGKSIATSVPSFAIRFHSGDEELEEVYPSAEETDDEAEKTEDDASSAKDTSGVSSPGDVAPGTTLTAAQGGSTSASATTAPSRDPSPMKEYLKGLGKRSTSMDAGIIDIGTFGSSGGDTWRLFHELKGKITKTVEEKFSEIKSDRKSGSSLLSSSVDPGRGGKLAAGGKSKENSSISDSEDVSEPSAKSVPEFRVGTPKMDQSASPRKISKDQKQSSSFDDKEKEDFHSDSLTDPPSTSSALEASDVMDLSQESVQKSKSNLRSKIRSLSNLRQRHKSGIKIPHGSSVTMSSLTVLQDDDSDVEPAIEVSEETQFPSEQVEADIPPDIPTVDYRTDIPTAHPTLPERLRRHRHARGFLSILRRHYVLILSVAVAVVCTLFSLPSYVVGFFCGAIFVMVFITIKNFFKFLVAPAPESPFEEIRFTKSVLFKVPHENIGIQKIPSVKEYEPLAKYAGWMNEYMDEYDPEKYSINDCQSVYIRLEGSILRISHTRMKIPKRAMWNERKHKLKFTHQRIYNIYDCDIKLLPGGLARRRLWSKKYPICITLKKCTKFGIKYLRDRNDNVDDLDTTTERGGSETERPELSSLESGFNSITTLPDDTFEDADPGTIQSSFLNDVNSELFQDVMKTGDDEEDEELSAQEDLSDDEDTFCHIDKTSLDETCLYLFGRTDREKEDWYRRFVFASTRSDSPSEQFEELVKGTHKEPKPAENSQEPSSEQSPDESSDRSPEKHVSPRELAEDNFEYLKFMSRFQLKVLTKKGYCVLVEPFSSRSHKVHPSSREKKHDVHMQHILEKEIHSEVLWMNAFVGRCLFDILRNPIWLGKLQDRIQKKLSAIKLPYFVEELLVTELDVGNTIPLVHSATVPMLDQRGLWVDLDISYEGALTLTLETKLNLMKLKKYGEEKTAERLSPLGKKGSPMFDSDIDDSAESSDDEYPEPDKSTSEDENVASTGSSTGGGGAGKKILRMVNKIAASKYFQQATEYKYIKRAMEEVSNTKIMLTVEVNGLVGVLAVNIPPHPSDRLWYGFRGNPRLWLSARPKFGERRVNIGHVVSWIEKKLIQEFQKKFVLPNMDDLVIPPMTSNVPDY